MQKGYSDSFYFLFILWGIGNERIVIVTLVIKMMILMILVTNMIAKQDKMSS